MRFQDSRQEILDTLGMYVAHLPEGGFVLRLVEGNEDIHQFTGPEAPTALTHENLLETARRCLTNATLREMSDAHRREEKQKSLILHTVCISLKLRCPHLSFSQDKTRILATLSDGDEVHVVLSPGSLNPKVFEWDDEDWFTSLSRFERENERARRLSEES